MRRRGGLVWGGLPGLFATVLRSVGFVNRSSGWQIEPDGTAEFNDDVYVRRGKGLQAQLDAMSFVQGTSLTLTTSPQDLPGLTTGAFTPTVDEVIFLWVEAMVHLAEGSAPCDAGDGVIVQIRQGAVVKRTQVQEATGAVGSLCNTLYWSGNLNADTEYTWKVTAYNGDGNRGQISGTAMMWWRLSR